MPNHYPTRSSANVSTLRNAFLVGLSNLSELVTHTEGLGFALPQWNSFVVDLDVADITTYAAYHDLINSMDYVLGADKVVLDEVTPTSGYRDILLNLGGYMDEQAKPVHLFRARLHISRERLGEEFTVEEVSAKRVDGTDYTYTRKVFKDEPYLDERRPREF